MSTEQMTVCLFCGASTEVVQQTRIGLVYVHPECLADLEEILSLTAEELEIQTLSTKSQVVQGDISIA